MAKLQSRKRPPGAAPINVTLVGAIIIVVAIVATILSYNANKGLPFVPTYEVKVEVPDAAELVPASSEVRIGGSRVGIVKSVDAVPAKPGRPAIAVLTIALAEFEGPLAVDTTAQVRPRSILGAKFLDLTRGRSKQTVPDGGTLALANAVEGVGIDEAFKVFEPKTRAALQDSVVNLGNGLAGRGGALNATIGEVAGLIPPLQRTLRTLVAPDTGLGRLIVAADGATAVLAPVAPEIAAILDDGATTLAAVDAARPALEQTIDQTPATLRAGRRAAEVARPVLLDGTALFRALRPGLDELPRASIALRRALATGTPVLTRVPQLTARLDAAVGVLDRVARQPTTLASIVRLDDAVGSLATTLTVLAPAQLTCNTLPVFFRNLASVVEEGDVAGSWFDTSIIIDGEQSLQQKRPSPELHSNPLPINDATQCETGNEPYALGQRIGSPGGAQPARTEETLAPAEATERGRAAGLVGAR